MHIFLARNALRLGADDAKLADSSAWVVDLRLSELTLVAGAVFAVTFTSMSNMGFMIAAIVVILAVHVVQQRRQQRSIKKDIPFELADAKCACIGVQDVAPPAISVARSWLQMARDSRARKHAEETFRNLQEACVTEDETSAEGDLSSSIPPELPGFESLSSYFPVHHDTHNEPVGMSNDCYEALLERKQNEPWGFVWNVAGTKAKRLIVDGVSADSPAGRWASRQQELRLQAFDLGDELVDANGACDRASMQRVMNDANVVLLRFVRSGSAPFVCPLNRRKQVAASASAHSGALSAAFTDARVECKVRNTFIHVVTHRDENHEERLTQSEPDIRLQDIPRLARHEHFASKKNAVTESCDSGTNTDSAWEGLQGVQLARRGRVPRKNAAPESADSGVNTDSAWEGPAGRSYRSIARRVTIVDTAEVVRVEDAVLGQGEVIRVEDALVGQGVSCCDASPSQLPGDPPLFFPPTPMNCFADFCLDLQGDSLSEIHLPVASENQYHRDADPGPIDDSCYAMSAEMHMDPIGQTAVISGLVLAPQFNGKWCHVESHDAQMNRYVVRVLQEQDLEGAVPLVAKLRLENLFFLPPLPQSVEQVATPTLPMVESQTQEIGVMEIGVPTGKSCSQMDQIPSESGSEHLASHMTEPLPISPDLCVPEWPCNEVPEWPFNESAAQFCFPDANALGFEDIQAAAKFCFPDASASGLDDMVSCYMMNLGGWQPAAENFQQYPQAFPDDSEQAMQTFMDNQYPEFYQDMDAFVEGDAHESDGGCAVRGKRRGKRKSRKKHPTQLDAEGSTAQEFLVEAEIEPVLAEAMATTQQLPPRPMSPSPKADGGADFKEALPGPTAGPPRLVQHPLPEVSLPPPPPPPPPEDVLLPIDGVEDDDTLPPPPPPTELSLPPPPPPPPEDVLLPAAKVKTRRTKAAKKQSLNSEEEPTNKHQCDSDEELQQLVQKACEQEAQKAKQRKTCTADKHQLGSDDELESIRHELQMSYMATLKALDTDDHEVQQQHSPSVQSETMDEVDIVAQVCPQSSSSQQSPPKEIWRPSLRTNVVPLSSEKPSNSTSEQTSCALQNTQDSVGQTRPQSPCDDHVGITPSAEVFETAVSAPTPLTATQNGLGQASAVLDNVRSTPKKKSLKIDCADKGNDARHKSKQKNGDKAHLAEKEVDLKSSKKKATARHVYIEHNSPYSSDRDACGTREAPPLAMQETRHHEAARSTAGEIDTAGPAVPDVSVPAHASSTAMSAGWRPTLRISKPRITDL